MHDAVAENTSNNPLKQFIDGKYPLGCPYTAWICPEPLMTAIFISKLTGATTKFPLQHRPWL